MDKEELRKAITLFLELKRFAEKRLDRSVKTNLYSVSAFLTGVMFGYEFCSLYLENYLD